jgi:hypothetical protein
LKTTDSKSPRGTGCDERKDGKRKEKKKTTKIKKGRPGIENEKNEKSERLPRFGQGLPARRISTPARGTSRRKEKKAREALIWDPRKSRKRFEQSKKNEGIRGNRKNPGGSMVAQRDPK